MSFNKLNTLRLKGRIYQCCQSLSAAAQYPSDAYLIQIVRLQNIADKINRHLSCDEPDSSLPIYMCVKSLQHELQTFKNSIPADLLKYRMFQPLMLSW
jgi:hypothetical protein